MSENFQLDDWLVGGTDHRARETVTIYRDANLGAKIAELESQIAEAEETGMDSLGENTPGLLEERKAELLEQIESAKATVEVYGLIDSEMAEVNRAVGEEADDITRTYAVLERAATLEGQRLTAEQWRKLHETVGTQFNRVATAYRLAVGKPVEARFRSRGTGEAR